MSEVYSPFVGAIAVLMECGFFPTHVIMRRSLRKTFGRTFGWDDPFGLRVIEVTNSQVLDSPFETSILIVDSNHYPANELAAVWLRDVL